MFQHITSAVENAATGKQGELSITWGKATKMIAVEYSQI